MNSVYEKTTKMGGWFKRAYRKAGAVLSGIATGATLAAALASPGCVGKEFNSARVQRPDAMAVKTSANSYSDAGSSNLPYLKNFEPQKECSSAGFTPVESPENNTDDLQAKVFSQLNSSYKEWKGDDLKTNRQAFNLVRHLFLEGKVEGGYRNYCNSHDYGRKFGLDMKALHKNAEGQFSQASIDEKLIEVSDRLTTKERRVECRERAKKRAAYRNSPAKITPKSLDAELKGIRSSLGQDVYDHLKFCDFGPERTNKLAAMMGSTQTSAEKKQELATAIDTLVSYCNSENDRHLKRLDTLQGSIQEQIKARTEMASSISKAPKKRSSPKAEQKVVVDRGYLRALGRKHARSKEQKTLDTLDESCGSSESETPWKFDLCKAEPKVVVDRGYLRELVRTHPKSEEQSLKDSIQEQIKFYTEMQSSGSKNPIKSGSSRAEPKVVVDPGYLQDICENDPRSKEQKTLDMLDEFYGSTESFR